MHLVLPLNEKIKKHLPIYPITLGFDHTQRQVYRPDGAPFHHFIYVNKGQGLFDFNGEQKTVNAGEAVFLKKHVPSGYCRQGDTFRTSWITFDGAMVEGMLEYFNVSDYAVLNHQGIGSMIEQICKSAERGATQDVLTCKAYELAIRFFTLLKKQTEPSVLEKAKRLIEERYGEDLSVETIARYLGISPSLLFKLFRTEEKSTPIEYLRSVRIEKAGQMLLEGKHRVYEIAVTCGFSDAAYFCKVFKEHTGDSPRSYQRKYGL